MPTGSLDTALDTPAIGAEEQRAATGSSPLPNAVSIGVEEWTKAVAGRTEYTKAPSLLLRRRHS